MNQANTQEQRVALVTGSARRIGAAIVSELHHAGYRVVIHCRFALAEAHALAAALNEQRPNSAQVLQQDLTHPAAAQQLISTTTAWAGRLDLLVNNASLFCRTDYTSYNPDDWQRLFTLNVNVPLMLSLAARHLLSKSAGAIINITDIHAAKPLKGYSLYCQSKAALTMQTLSLAREFAPDIRVNAVAPGAIAWPEQANSLSPKAQQQIIEQTPLRRHGHPQFIAAAVLALASNPFITGQILNVDGGRSIS